MTTRRLTTAEAVDLVYLSTDDSELDHAARVLNNPDCSLGDVATVLRLLIGVDDVLRLDGLLASCVAALGRFDDRTRYAPPAALKEAVREYAEPCVNDECTRVVTPWEDAGSGACSATCESTYLRRVGA